MHVVGTVLLIFAGASMVKHAPHSGTHHPQKVHPVPVAHNKSKADCGQYTKAKFCRNAVVKILLEGVTTDGSCKWERAGDQKFKTCQAVVKANVVNQSCLPLVKPGEISRSASMVDPTVKLLLISSPKAGATLVERLMLARVNLTGAAMHYKMSPYPLKYSHEVFQKAKGRMPTPGHVASCGGRWLCLAIVRNPLDRAISSYIHTLLYWESVGAH